MPPKPPDDSELDELRTEETQAMRRLFFQYGRGEFPQFVLGAIASIFPMSMEQVSAYILAVAIDSLFFDTTPFALPVIPDTWIPTNMPNQFALAGGILAGAYVLGSILRWVNSWAWDHFAQHFQHAVRIDTHDVADNHPIYASLNIAMEVAREERYHTHPPPLNKGHIIFPLSN
jgi:ATP-binding cassette subfamily B protein